MKKFKVCLFISCLVVCLSCVSFGATFYDIKGTQYEGVVERIAELGVINGISENTFAPNKGITRAELAKMIVYTRGLQGYADSMNFSAGFSDVKKEHWARNYIRVACDLGLLKGYEDGTFKPEKEVSYAETVAIVLRILGYSNIDESVTPWYSNYTKKMFDLKLNQGMSTFNAFTSSAKRGDVAVLWWNMLVSDRWVISSENDKTGLNYTYSDVPQLEVLFPDYTNIKGTVSGVVGESGDMITIKIGKKEYTTASNIPIYALGATASGVYDKKNEVMYGFSIDDDIANSKIVAGPIFYLESQGYDLKRARNKASYGSSSSARYAYLVTSKDGGIIYRVVYVNASDSILVNEIKVNSSNKSGKDDENYVAGAVLINGEEYTTSDAAVIKNGKKVKWSDIPKNAVVTALIKDALYTYETKTITGTITNYKDLDNLYIDGDRYIVANDCVYTIDGNKETYNYSEDMDKKELEKLMPRDITFYLNVAEEIYKIEFGKYKDENIDKKYEDSEYQFVYVTASGVAPESDKYTIKGVDLNGEKVSYKVPSKFYCDVGDLVALSKIKGKVAGAYEIVDKSKKFEDVSFLYDSKDEYYNEAFGEYTLTEDTIILKVTKKYEDNSIDKIAECSVSKYKEVEALGDLSKYKIHIFYNEKMDIEVLVVESAVNKVNYQIARISDISFDKEGNKEGKNDLKIIQVVSARLSVIGRTTTRYNMYSGDAEEGELVTFEVNDKDYITIKERFKTAFIGYKNDICVEHVTGGKVAEVTGTKELLDLREDTYTFNGKTYDLAEYRFVFARVGKTGKTGDWEFVYAEFADRNTFTLKLGDRIAFDELSGVAVIYRGYED